MRAGLIIAGAFMMVFGAVLGFTIIFLLMGILFGLIGLVMLIVGCVTSGRKQPQAQQIVYAYPPPTYPQPTTYQQPPTYPPQNNFPYPSVQPPHNQRYCGTCGTPNPTTNQYCAACGKKLN
jgi:hypothetical protein